MSKTTGAANLKRNLGLERWNVIRDASGWYRAMDRAYVGSGSTGSEAVVVGEDLSYGRACAIADSLNEIASVHES